MTATTTTPDQLAAGDPALAGIQLLTVRQVAAALGVDARTCWRLLAKADVGEGSFPQPLRLGARTIRWRLRDLETYLAGLAGGGRG